MNTNHYDHMGDAASLEAAKKAKNVAKARAADAARIFQLESARAADADAAAARIFQLESQIQLESKKKPDDKGFPVLPVALAAGVVAFLLLRK